MTEVQPYQYRAFISYRHQSPDQEIARKLHTMIETFGIPKALQKSQGISSMGRVFRDQEELPLSSDLGADIHRALEGSEWLICICSPRYLQSRWCMEELRYFISLGRRDHVLAVLIEDEPVNSFPEQLRFYEKDGVRIEQEPLAADVRSDSIEESLKKLKSEKLRIIAPMLGVRYDDLKQRARQRRYRIMATAAMAVILLLSGFLGYVIFKNSQITAQKNAAMISQSKFLASQADELLNTSGDRMLTILLAREALPEDFDDPDRPVTSEALYALRTALVSGMSSQYVTVTDFDISIRDSRSSGNTLAIISDDLDGYLGLFDLNSGKQLSSYHLEKRPYKTSISNDLSTIYCTDSSGFHRISESNGQSEDILLYSYTYFDEFSTPISASEDCTSFVFSDGGHMLVTGTDVPDKTGILFEDGYSHSGPVYFGNGMYLTAVMNPEYGDISMLRIDENTEHFRDAVIHDYYIRNVNGMDYADDSFVFEYAPSSDRSRVIGLTYEGIYVWNAETAVQLIGISALRFDGSRLKHMQVSSSDSRIAVITENQQIYIWDYLTNEVNAADIGNYHIDSVHFAYDGSMLCTDTGNDAAILIDRSGKTVQTITADFSLTDAVYITRDNMGNSADDSFILLIGEKKARLLKLDESDSGLVTQLPECNAFMDDAVLSPDGREIWYYSNTGEVYHLLAQNIESGQTTVIEELNSNEVQSFHHLQTLGSNYISVSGIDPKSGSSLIRIYDCLNHEPVKDIYPEISADGIADNTAELYCAFTAGDYAVYEGSTVSASSAMVIIDVNDLEQKIGLLDDWYWGNTTYKTQNEFLLIHGEMGSRQYDRIINTRTWQQEAYQLYYPAGTFCGMVTGADIEGYSTFMSIYLSNTQTCITDMLTGLETVIDLDDTSAVTLSSNHKGLVLLTGKGYYLWDGSDFTAYDPQESELIIPAHEDLHFLTSHAYQQDGILYDSTTGKKLIDFKSPRLTVISDCSSGSRLLLKNGDGIYVFTCLDGNDLLKTAEELLNGRKLTKAEKEEYFIE